MFLTSLLCYSFTQVDLNLTLSRIDIWFGIQDFFQHIGYYNRPFSTGWYLITIAGLFILYGVILYATRRNSLSEKHVWHIITLTVVMLFLSYPAFSYDLFNYMFDARIVTEHGANPYLHKALDYPDDPWITFMRWTHRTYPYGPVWLFLTVPLSYGGMKIFLMTMYLFKLLMVGGYVGSALILSKILRKVTPEKATFGLAFFALNPLVIIESLVSAHHDIVMMFFALVAVYLLLERKFFTAFLAIGASIGIKFATVLMTPAFVIAFIQVLWIRRIQRNLLFMLILAGMVIAVIIASLRTQFQPWYLLFVLPFTPVFIVHPFVTLPAVLISFTALIMYVPFLYTGNWDPPIPVILNGMVLGGIILAIFTSAIYSIIHKKL
ncbi:hypothetical protein HY468_03575 [Candidatus Roizmanbacteria bacterium]|nr:hypothetical protein [Candidatus Roizmanbacteria bacterium]